MSNKIELIEEKMKEIMEILDLKFNDSTKGTPHRIAKMWVNEAFKNRNNETIEELNSKMKLFENTSKVDDLVIIKDIPFVSFCEHHFLPFIGKAHIGYIPDRHLIGLSKIPRVVDYFSKKPQLQERMGQEIRDYLFDLIKPKAIYVYLDDVVHTCVLARGIEKESKTDTFTSKSGNIDKQLYITKMNEFLSRIGR